MHKEFSNRWLWLIPGMAVAIFIYFSWWVPSQECAGEIVYHPAETNWQGAQEEYYSYSFDIEQYTITFDDESEITTPGFTKKKFKTKSEAIKFCLRSS